MDLIGKLLTGVLGAILVKELKDWTPWIIQRLINWSAARLPDDRQERFQEEWSSHVAEVPGDIGKIVVALGFYWAALRMSWILGVAYEQDLFAERTNRESLTRVPAPSGAISCPAPVAEPHHRLIATAYDAAMILAGLGIFLAIFLVSGGHVTLTLRSLQLMMGVGSVVALIYRCLWSMAGSDTPGMRVAGIRLVDFDGFYPCREQRGMRLIAGLLSVLTGGLGLFGLWSIKIP